MSGKALIAQTVAIGTATALTDWYSGVSWKGLVAGAITSIPVMMSAMQKLAELNRQRRDRQLEARLSLRESEMRARDVRIDGLLATSASLQRQVIDLNRIVCVHEDARDCVAGYLPEKSPTDAGPSPSPSTTTDPSAPAPDSEHRDNGHV